MICFVCHRPVRGAEVPGRCEWRQVPGGEVTVHGEAAGVPLRGARGQLLRLCHRRCYHVYVKQQALAASRAADPSAQPGPDQDWRHQEVLDVEELTGHGNEGNRDHRGAGTAG